MKQPNQRAHLELRQRNSDTLEIGMRYPNQLQGSVYLYKLWTTIGELQQPRNKTVPPFRRTMINSY